MKSILPKAVRDLSTELNRLPGIGPKTARRLAIHLLRQPRSVVSRLGDTLKNLHANVKVCRRCYNLSEQEVCAICQDTSRDQSQLCIVENPLDVEAIWRTGSYNGIFHVLGGALSPLEGIGPEELTISELMIRLGKEEIKEIIFALNPTLEGEATTRHISRQIEDRPINTTKLGRGLPTGGDIEFADNVTIAAAFEGRRQVQKIDT
ncbi:MAG: recombination protein RecR [Candidatus Andersenbacteria bacterium RIFCSPHIGHO2_12_FULL_46_9]|nr:MAG: Recombination protein RecR [Parcubacteria group bacterium GW2011_GWA2_45_14]OGY33997.1 MAG: recombination protein RecR [Candidatus Andersenbacteria bacterium RIFCSPHIGHO2_02_FULL_46_16]OGY35325.1 MAG: recombination protein RecR [Candidatus Andersenbacteria bacterium RIFCSPHIGHO2_12_FULL_46_9]OGY36999.1 MAG: recombination protein RecR [Candidatus Andersenbacteria bacterium RIFCSPLOWO2_02_FULL_46_11]HBE90292.1 recombination protein RecR [Candidatus Andersenbacteria bacterium]